MMTVILETKQLTKKFGDNLVLKGIDSKIEQGQVIAVIGPSGSGKSTYHRCLNLLEQPTSGSVVFEDQTINQLTENELDKIREKWGWSSNLLTYLQIIRSSKM